MQPWITARYDMADVRRAMAGINSQSTYYEILVITAEAQRMAIDNGKMIKVGGVAFRVRDRLMIDDGAFSLVSLTEI